MPLSTLDVRRKRAIRVLPLKGRLILAFLRALVGAFKAAKTFAPRATGLGAGFIGSDKSHRWDGGGPARAVMWNGEVRMLLTEHDAVMAKWCPMIRRRWEA